MSTLSDYLVQKRAAVLARREEAARKPEPAPLKAEVRVLGRSGVREIRIRDLQVISDSGPGLAGYNLGPSSPELQLGVLGSCISHITLIQAAVMQVPLETVEVEVTALMHPMAQKPGFEEVPLHPYGIRYELRIGSSAPAEQIRALHEAVEKNCPIMSLLTLPQTVEGALRLNGQAL